MAFFDAEQASVDAERRSAFSRIRQKRAEASAKRREAAGLSAEIKALEEQLSIREALFEQGSATRSSLLELKSSVAEAQSRILAVFGQAESADIAAEALAQEIEQQAATRRAEWARARTDAETELAELTPQIAKQYAVLSRLDVRAPVDGAIQSLEAATPGSVVPSGGLIATIVPKDDQLIAEVRVRPDDIGHIDVGGHAFVRVTTFDADAFGEIHGEVLKISPTSFESDNGDRYFLARLSLDHLTAEHGERQLQLAPGMMVQAEIKTGSKSVLKYLLKPVVRSLEHAFSER